MSPSQQSDLESSALGIIEGESNLIANLANLSSVIFHGIPGVNWVGFYLWNEADGELVLGPFQGKPACLRIKEGRGVCGKSFETGEALLVEDVHKFADHIACDPESESELVIPLKKGNKRFGVLDLDAPTKSFFNEEHKIFLEKLIEKVSEKIFC